MTRDRRKLWPERLFDALELLSARLDDPPSLSELAAAAELSPFHFHRVWRAMLNEPVHQTVARLRVAAAQQKLRLPDSTVTSVAMDAGFGTPQSFARAFRRVSGLSPSEFASSALLKVGVEAKSSAPAKQPCAISATGQR